jgi:hypothetical protein
LISQLRADLLAVGRGKGFSESAIYPDHFAFRPQFGASLLEDQFDPHSLPVHTDIRLMEMKRRYKVPQDRLQISATPLQKERPCRFA